MKKTEKPKPKGRKPAEGDQRQFLTTMDPEVIKGVKLAAIEDDTTASIVLGNGRERMAGATRLEGEEDLTAILLSSERVWKSKKGAGEKCCRR